MAKYMDANTPASTTVYIMLRASGMCVHELLEREAYTDYAA